MATGEHIKEDWSVVLYNKLFGGVAHKAQVDAMLFLTSTRRTTQKGVEHQLPGGRKEEDHREDQYIQ